MKRLYKIQIIFFILMILSVMLSAENSGKKVILSPAEKKGMNTFFSNFSEIFVMPFTKGSLKDSDLILFGVSHNYRNNPKLFVESGSDNYVKIKENLVNDSVKKFFGKKIGKHQPVEGIKYSNGWYIIPEASGEAFIFSQVAEFYDNGNNIYSAIVNVYSGETDNVHGTAAEWKKTAGADNIPELSAVMKATVQKVTENGKSRYILIEYTKVK